MHFKFIDKIASKFSFGSLNKLVGQNVISIVYHVVGEREKLPYMKGLYHIPDENQFVRDMDFLLKQYKPIDLKELYRYYQSGELPGNDKYFFLSFDDGLRQCTDIIAPVLKQKGIPATFFVNTGFIDNIDFLHRFKIVLLSDAVKADKSNRLKQLAEDFFNMEFTCRYKAAKYLYTLRFPQKETIHKFIEISNVPVYEELNKFAPYMTQSDLKMLVKQGHTIGAHSHEHPEFYLLPENQQLEQARISLEKIKEWLSPDILAFAFPFTDDGVTNQFFTSLNSLTTVNLTFASAGLKKDRVPNHVHRISMDDYGYGAEQRLKSEFLYYLVKKPMGRNTLRRK